MRYFMELSYEGTAYHGWQRQQNAYSIQEAIEEQLSTILRVETPIIGAGRTDTGVHAAYYVAHFDTETPIENIPNILHRLNLMLPSDIAVKNIISTDEQAHARFDAIEREYKYYVINKKDPFRSKTAWEIHPSLNVKEMNRAASHLLGADDFTTFSKLHSNNRTCICKVTHAEWTECEECLVFTIRADRFLRNMVRSIVGTLIDVGRGKISPDRFKQILDATDRSLSSGSAAAQGLFLTNIRYPDNLFHRDFVVTGTEAESH